jgi:hypothetical protein
MFAGRTFAARTLRATFRGRNNAPAGTRVRPYCATQSARYARRGTVTFPGRPARGSTFRKIACGSSFLSGSLPSKAIDPRTSATFWLMPWANPVSMSEPPLCMICTSAMVLALTVTVRSAPDITVWRCPSCAPPKLYTQAMADDGELDGPSPGLVPPDVVKARLE